jgi:3-oxoadipate enol-lactonase
MEEAYGKGDLTLVNEIAMQLFVDGKGRTPDQVLPALRQKVYAMNQIALENEKSMGRDVPLDVSAAQRIGDLHLPVLIIYGDLDEEYIHRAADFMATSIPGSHKILMPGTAHLPNMEFPNEFNAHVQAFLGGL